MVTVTEFKKLALSFSDTVELPHFEKTSFRVGKKIFATLAVETRLAVVKFSEVDQSVFCAFDKEIIYPVANKWGKQGWTVINLDKVKKNMLRDALSTAYNELTRSKTKKK